MTTTTQLFLFGKGRDYKCASRKIKQNSLDLNPPLEKDADNEALRRDEALVTGALTVILCTKTEITSWNLIQTRG